MHIPVRFLVAIDFPNTATLYFQNAAVRRLSFAKYKYLHGFNGLRNLLLLLSGQKEKIWNFTTRCVMSHVTRHIFLLPVHDLIWRVMQNSLNCRYRRPCCYAPQTLQMFLYKVDFKLRSWRQNAFILQTQDHPSSPGVNISFTSRPCRLARRIMCNCKLLNSRQLLVWNM